MITTSLAADVDPRTKWYITILCFRFSQLSEMMEN